VTIKKPLRRKGRKGRFRGTTFISHPPVRKRHLSG